MRFNIFWVKYYNWVEKHCRPLHRIRSLTDSVFSMLSEEDDLVLAELCERVCSCVYVHSVGMLLEQQG